MTSAFGPAAETTSAAPGTEIDLEELFSGPESVDGFLGFGLAEFAWLIGALGEHGVELAIRAGIDLSQESDVLVLAAVSGLAARDLVEVPDNMLDSLERDEAPMPRSAALALASTAATARAVIRVVAVDGDETADDHLVLVAPELGIWALTLPGGARMVRPIPADAASVAAFLSESAPAMLEGAGVERTVAIELSAPDRDDIDRLYLRGSVNSLRMVEGLEGTPQTTTGEAIARALETRLEVLLAA